MINIMPQPGSFGTAAHFSIEPLQIMWNQKKVLLTLLVFPWIIPHLIFQYLLPYIVSLYTSENISFVAAPIIITMLQPLWAIAWIRHVFYPKEQPTVKSYFSFNRSYWYFLGCALMMQILRLPMEYIEEIDVLNKLSILALWLLWTIFMLPINLAFPAISIQKPFAPWKSWSLARIFYSRYLLSIGLITIILSLASITLIFIAESILAVLYITTPTIFQFLTLWWPQTLVAQLGSLLATTYLLTLPALYYKEYLFNK
jgi:hypothetical protein